MPTRQLNKSAFTIIQKVFTAAAHSPDPQTSARNATRAVTITGRLLQGIADENFEQASPLARRITQFGMLAYGIVELSVPHSLGEIMFLYWRHLFFLVGVILVILGVVLTRPPVWQIGVIILLIVWALDCVSLCLRRFMLYGKFPVRTVLGRIVVLLFVVILVRPVWPLHILQSIERPLFWLQSLEAHARF